MRFFAKVSLFLFTSLQLFLQGAYADPPLPTPVGRVVWVKGQLKAMMSNQEQRILQKMSVIYLHDTLITDADSTAQIVFTDESLLSFYPNTRFSIDHYEYHHRSKKESFGKSAMRLIEGGFRTITGLIAKNSPVDYQVNTPVATIGVRGTDYAVYLKNKQLYVGYYKGTPCITGKDKGQTTLCLSDKTRYASVASAGAVPVPLSARPDVFQQTLEITPTKITPFATQSGGHGAAATSFCITQ